ncbi:DNA adenine methylase [Candidatus Tokpelaia sp.]|uniref:DNA adenine methylase n=1 Tax=Candidatus Tokpelaia sp. TaxID=2233777 RepID=UPI00123A1D90|nr:DNA adenine methylase [Candidatus Tokpelaia sp.]KAA6404516.1 DNA adenine methylase [Candidatus Tokpelaia sp.]
MINENMIAVAPTQPPSAYFGGKMRLAKLIIERIDAVPHNAYAEPFLGMGGIFLRRGKKPANEVVNDISGNVVTLFRVLQRHYPYFLDFLKFRLTSRAEFERLQKANPDTLTDLERAARFLYLQRTAYSGKPANANFAVDRCGRARFNVLRLEAVLSALNERLAGVVIEQLPYADFISRYDREGMLFYLDPPYLGNEQSYGKGIFAREDFAMLAELLAGIKGRFIMSLNAHADIYRLFSGFRIETVDVRYSTGIKHQDAKEVLISNG